MLGLSHSTFCCACSHRR